MNNAHIIAKLVSSQITRDLTSGQQARVTFQIKPSKKWIRGRFDEVTCIFVPTGSTAKNLVGLHVDVLVVSRTVDNQQQNPQGKWYHVQQNGGYDFLVKLLTGKQVFDLNGPGVVFEPEVER